MTHERFVPIGDLIALDIEEQEARILCDGAAFIEWHKLARRDGAIALAVLDDAEFELITKELLRAGIPDTATLTRETVAHLVWAAAEAQVPPFPWYDRTLHSAVACAHLLTFVHQAWGYDADAERQRQSENFASLLGVAQQVEEV